MLWLPFCSENDKVTYEQTEDTKELDSPCSNSKMEEEQV